MDKTILYIEDNHDNRVLLKRVLEVEGYQVIEASSGVEGISLATQNPPDLILMDINLPDIDGYEITRRLRATSSLAKTPILAVTANVMSGDREKSLLAGCNDYIRKPVDIDLLPKQIERHLIEKEEAEDVGKGRSEL